MALEQYIDKNGVVHYYYTRAKKKGAKGHEVPHSEESKEKIREGAEKLWQTEKRQRQNFEQQYYLTKNSINITNGVENRRLLCGEEMPKGWWRGRVYKRPMEEIRAIFRVSNHYGNRKKGDRLSEFADKEDSKE